MHFINRASLNKPTLALRHDYITYAMKKYLPNNSGYEDIDNQTIANEYIDLDMVNYQGSGLYNPADLPQKVQYMQLDDITLCFQQLAPNDPQSVPIRVNTPSIQMNFVLEGQRSYKPAAGYGPPYHLPTGYHSIAYYTAMKGELWYTQEEDSIIVDLSFPESYLRTAFGDDLTQLGNLEKAVAKRQSALLGNRTFPLTPTQKGILLAMSSCSLDGPLKKLFLEGKLLELLVLQVEQFQATSVSAGPQILSQEDVEKLQLVQATLLNTIDQPPSINELSRLVGLNRTKLMSGFKELFGNTIYGYLADVRMERAKELMLANTYMKIAEVARQVGFRSANNFSAAFKKKFGYSPTALR
jgi:AraC-like DNA-binding protein